MAKNRKIREKSEKKEQNPMADKPLVKLLVKRVDGIIPASLGFPRWAMTKCKKLGVITIADLYRLIYLDPSRPGVGSKFVILAQKVLSGLALNDRIGLVDPIEAVVKETRLEAFRESNGMLADRLEEHGNQIRKGFDAQLASLEELNRLRIEKIVTGFRRREGILRAKLKEVTREEMSFTADSVSPESAQRWLTLHAADRVPDGFAIKAKLIYLTRHDLPFVAGITLGLASHGVANALVAHSQRSESMIEAPGRFCLDYPGKRVEVAEAGIQVRFTERGPGRLARLEGIVTIEGMSDAEIKKLFIPADSAEPSDDDALHGEA